VQLLAHSDETINSLTPQCLHWSPTSKSNEQSSASTVQVKLYSTTPWSFQSRMGLLHWSMGHGNSKGPPPKWPISVVWGLNSTHSCTVRVHFRIISHYICQSNTDRFPNLFIYANHRYKY